VVSLALTRTQVRFIVTIGREFLASVPSVKSAVKMFGVSRLQLDCDLHSEHQRVARLAEAAGLDDVLNVRQRGEIPGKEPANTADLFLQ
jgi:transposase InsO family protein